MRNLLFITTILTTLLFSTTTTAGFWDIFKQKPVVQEAELLEFIDKMNLVDFNVEDLFLNNAPVDNELLVLPLDDREILLRELAPFKDAHLELKKKLFRRDLRIDNKNKELQLELVGRIMYYGTAMRLLGELSHYPAVMGLMYESDPREKEIRNFFRSTFYKINRDTGWDPEDDEDHAMDFEEPELTMYELLEKGDSVLSSIDSFEMNGTIKNYAKQAFKDLITYRKILNKNRKKYLGNPLMSRFLYHVKAGLLDFFGKIQLPMKNLIGEEFKEQLTEELEPGDILVVNKDKALSNVAFVGWWSHGQLHIGSYSKLKRYFEDDDQTQEMYKLKCFQQDLDCDDFVSYMEKRFPNYFQAYKFSEIDGTHPLMVIESVAAGVQLSDAETTFHYNRMAAFRPKRTKLEKAAGIEEAFKLLGKSYDYGFDARTTGRIVCTEVIMYAYMKNDKIGKRGIPWEMSVNFGVPAMYAFDIVKTYFNNKNAMDFLYYIESPRHKNHSKAMTEEELQLTLTLDKDEIDTLWDRRK